MSRILTYFAYGTNLLTKAMLLNNPNAVRIGIGKIKDYRLDFSGCSRKWQGSATTIVSHSDFYVWGALWEFNIADLSSLDQQQIMYSRFTVIAELPDGCFEECEVYELTDGPSKYYKLRDLPPERQPSRTLKDVLIKGAEESCLPCKYIQILRSIRTNGNHIDW